MVKKVEEVEEEEGGVQSLNPRSRSSHKNKQELKKREGSKKRGRNKEIKRKEKEKNTFGMSPLFVFGFF